MEVKWLITLADLNYDEEEVKAVSGVLRSRWLTMGEEVADFEEQVKKAFSVNDAIMVNSGTAALHLALRAIDCADGDEVILPALTFVATPNAVLYCRSKPVFADITSLLEPNISPQAIEKAISEKTKAVIAVHYAGYSCQLGEIKRLLRDFEKRAGKKIWLIEDSAHAIGGKTTTGEWLGAAGDIGCFSFFSNKNLATGEGGMVVTNNVEVGEKIRSLRSHSMTRSTLEQHYRGISDYDVVDLGYNYRPTEITAALAKAQFKKLGANNQRRRELTAYYHKLLGDVSTLQLPFSQPEKFGQPASHIFPVLFENEATVKGIREYLHQKGIQSSHHYRPVVDFSYYRQLFGDRSANLPLTFEYSRRELTLPLHQRMAEQDVELIVSEIKTGLKLAWDKRLTANF